MEYMSAREAAEKWGISQRRVAVLCSEQRIAEAAMVGNMWIIPTNAKKPVDARSLRYIRGEENACRPFLKWAGGKGQLLPEIEQYYPFEETGIRKYAEPFVGSGAVLFDILAKYDLEEVYISDINPELMNAYHVLCSDSDSLIEMLHVWQEEFLPLDSSDRKAYYMQKREQFNECRINGGRGKDIRRAALMIFLNKTCLSGLFRVNKKRRFNVPMGSYKNPLICDDKNLLAASRKLQNVEIVCGDYRESAEFIDKHTFAYFDPPYRPAAGTTSFTAYTENLFRDDEQREFAQFAAALDRKGAKLLISSSVPGNADTGEHFFDKLYSAYRIKRVEAARAVHCNSKPRGKMEELLISNF